MNIDPLFVIYLVVTAIIALVYEVYRASQKQTTISQQIWSFEAAWPPILFLAGALAGHLFLH